jgi:phage shock protein E
MRLLAVGAVVVVVAIAAVTFATQHRANVSARPTASEARSLYDSGVQFIDVRTDEEWAAGHLKSAIHLPVSDVTEKASALLPDQHKPIVTYCASGVRAEKAAQALRAQGYTHVIALAGGFDDLKATQYPVSQ